ncbi:VOC family protein [Streptomyces sp. NPDC101151]|uniref:VOC family protein n=1 Tax=Streptomyces sp. NPDC101151 TaxID=3366115 RepID=UPI0037FD036E
MAYELFGGLLGSHWSGRKAAVEEDVVGDATVTRGAHIAFTARDRASVDAFYEAALTAGGTSRYEPRPWPEYRAYCAFVDDPDGNNIEAVYKEQA